MKTIEYARWLYHELYSATDIGRRPRHARLQLSCRIRSSPLNIVVTSSRLNAHISCIHPVLHQNSDTQLPERMIPFCQLTCTPKTIIGSIWCPCTPQAGGTTFSDTFWSL